MYVYTRHEIIMSLCHSGHCAAQQEGSRSTGAVAAGGPSGVPPFRDVDVTSGPLLNEHQE